MRCQTCDYSLWNLTRRDCPECGKAFVPSDFEFEPNAVQYCCPHCEQVYYGDGPGGHLRPIEFDCVQCGQHVHMDQMVLRPAGGFGDDNSVVTSEYTRRGTLARAAGSYQSLIGSVDRSADGMVEQIVYGDVAGTTTSFSYDDRRRLSSVQTYRGPPSIWDPPATGYTPAPVDRLL